VEKTLSERIKEHYYGKGIEEFLLDFAEDYTGLVILLLRKGLITLDDLRDDVVNDTGGVHGSKN
jgi:hypothetical protein